MLYAQYLFDEGKDDIPTTAVDIAGGGSGNHNGTYDLDKSSDGNYLSAGGYNGTHLRTGNTLGYGVHTFANESDFAFLGVCSFTFWFRYEDDNDIYIAGYDNHPGDDCLWRISFHSNNVIRMHWEDAMTPFLYNVDTPNGTCPSDGDWHHYAVVRKLFGAGPNLEVLFYIDGVLVHTDDNGASGYLVPSGGGSSQYMTIGHTNTTRSNTGHIDSLRIYNSVLSAGDILSIYNTELPEMDTTAIGVELIEQYDEDSLVSSIAPYNVVGMGYLSDNQNVGFVVQENDPHNRAYCYWPMREHQHFPTSYKCADITSNLKHQQLGDGAGNNLPFKIPDYHGYYFDGANSYMVGDVQPIVDANESITIEVVFRLNTNLTINELVSRSSATAINYLLRYDSSSNQLKFYFRNSADTSTRFWRSTTSLDSKTIYHLIFKHTFGDSNSTKCYINNTDFAGSWFAGGSEQPLYDATWKVHIGCRDVSTSLYRFLGYIYNVAIWKELLSEDEVAVLYAKSLADRYVV